MTLAQPLACLIDEDLDPALAGQLAVALDWYVTLVRAEGWLGVKNGPLLQAMAEAHLRLLVTGGEARSAEHGQDESCRRRARSAASASRNGRSR